MNTSIMIRYFSVILILLSVIVSITDSFINSMTTMSLVNSRKKNIVRNKKDIPYRKFSNENEKYLYGNYLVSLRKFKRAINYSKLFNLPEMYLGVKTPWLAFPLVIKKNKLKGFNFIVWVILLLNPSVLLTIFFTMYEAAEPHTTTIKSLLVVQ